MKCLIPTDKKKSAEDILLEAVLNIRAGIPEPVAYEKIINVVLEWYGVDLTYFSSNRRKLGLSKEQRVCMYLLHEIGRLEYDQIAKIMERKDSVSVVYDIDRITRGMKKNEKLRIEILEIAEKLK